MPPYGIVTVTRLHQITFIVQKIWSHTPSANGFYSRQSDEILVDLNFNIS